MGHPSARRSATTATAALNQSSWRAAAGHSISIKQPHLAGTVGSDDRVPLAAIEAVATNSDWRGHRARIDHPVINAPLAKAPHALCAAFTNTARSSG
jgi:hypothetical protein